jgi:crotonobetainyl-CoA:carnitine CoA-transferase CaiB-like acyl-CoA transferase
MGEPERLFPLIATALPIPGALKDPRFTTEAARVKNREALVGTLDEALARVADHPSLVRLLEGTPLIAVPVRTTQELAETDWAEHRNALTESGPGLYVPTAPWRSRDLPIGPPTPHIAFRGEHNRVVLNEWLGRDDDACQSLEDSGILESSAEEPRTLDQAPRSAFRESDSEAS